MCIMDMKKIPLTQGKFSLVDDEDYDRVMLHKWMYRKPSRKTPSPYAFRTPTVVTSEGIKKQVNESLHRFIMNVSSKSWTEVVVDHINMDGLDNRKCNLRLCDRFENLWNNRRIPGESGYIGVKKVKKKYMARISLNGKSVYLGLYNTKEEAAKAFNDAAKQLRGEFAKLNTIQ